MTHALGVFWAVAHRRPQDYSYFEKLGPPVFKIQDGGPPDYAWAREKLPATLVVARDWALGEQKSDMRRAPEETGKRHAQEWKTRQARLGFAPAKTLVLGVNEPEVWAVDGLSAAEAIARTVRYTVAFLGECKALGLRAGALQLSVGWPANTGTDTPPDWSPYAPVRDAILRGNHALVLHEYWADLGPSEHWGWWGGRALKCPWEVPIVIGECGFEMAVKRGGLKANERGWQSYIGPDAYADQLVDYTNRMAGDSRILGVCPFLSDYQNGEWQTLDVEPAYGAILARKGKLRPVAESKPATPTPATINAPAGANVRRGPDTSTPILRTLPKGTVVKPTGTNPAGTWLALADGGWVHRELVSGTPAGLPIVVVAPVPEKGPVTPEPAWEKSLAFVLRWEGGWADDPNDPGGATMKGITLGTFKRWRKAHGVQLEPTKEDLRAISDAEVAKIYREWYWDASGAGQLAWPLCLAHFDAAVNSGPGQAAKFRAVAGGDFVKYMGERIDWYTRIANFEHFGRAWVRRCADVLRVGSASV